MNNEELWKAALGEIELSISKANFSTWFKDTAIVSNDKGKLVIGVPNGFAKEWLENKFNSCIIKALRNLQHDIRELNCVIYSQGIPARSRDIDAVKAPGAKKEKVFSLSGIVPHALADSNLNDRYTFENFVVGENNELARAACFAVSQNLGRLYNPLFIYGGVGLGKTHLLQSIGNEILRNDPAKKIKYITSEAFTGELIDSIKNQKIAEFKNNYQKIDLLIIDDVQFLSGKEKTQNEFFHIFNALYQINKQIVISSDRPPKAIPTIEERLRSRFEGGMITDIGRPDLETRMAILRAKMAEKDFFIEEDSIKYIAENIKNNIRELEGALNKVIASCEFNKKAPSLPFTKQVLAEVISSGRKKGVNNKNIISAVSDFYEINSHDLINKGRKKEIVRPRQIAMYLMRSELGSSYPSIGECFGGRDHTTALHAFEKIGIELENDEKLKEDVETLKERIYSILN